MKKVRLDQLVFDQGLSESRERAKAIIMSGVVYVNGQRADKPGAQVAPDAKIEVRGNTLPYVSRGGFKLEKALKVFPVDPTGLTCIDCGASTGGFTDVLLQNGAAKVYAVDVGYGQLAWSLRNDPRVISIERTNVRYITSDQIPEPLDLAVMDLSFISVKLILPAVCPLLKDDAAVVCLIKPQFEAGREEVGKKGVVRDPKVHLEVLESFLDFVPGAGFTVMGLDYSPIKGPEGNIEYLGYLRKGMHPAPELDPAAVVEQSHGALAHGKRAAYETHCHCGQSVSGQRSAEGADGLPDAHGARPSGHRLAGVCAQVLSAGGHPGTTVGAGGAGRRAYHRHGRRRDDPARRGHAA